MKYLLMVALVSLAAHLPQYSLTTAMDSHNTQFQWTIYTLSLRARVTVSVTQNEVQRVYSSTPLTLFAWLRARVRP